ncbi:hypothetical protein QBC46DRAFT_421871 [Diplogelasinospora grovesii]|uniref:histidine kinase n=1 Tax=Diplogelasinospora grovesii TaxID=303347 RepID=A0AAN6N0J9_9PEZI|nr:hypothetical protein QBC46DRAFT_421871 [Diplogelasinospora grovesii]
MTRNVSERARERETLKYLHTVRESRIIHDASKAVLHPGLTSLSDTVLTALSQLGALRLGAQRALISLFDDNLQHIVAEATPTLSLQPNSEDPTDLVVSVVPDLLADGRFCDSALVCGEPQQRFYAGVSICSASGIPIGIFCIFGKESRTGLDDSSIQFMKDLSRAVSAQLESHRTQIGLRQSERIVRGVMNYVEGKGNLSARDAEERRWEQRGRDDPVKAFRPPEPVPEIPDAGPIDAASLGSVTEFETPRYDGPPFGGRETNHYLVEIKKSLAKAANIIRECIEVEGALFVDAIHSDDDDSSDLSASGAELGARGQKRDGHRLSRGNDWRRIISAFPGARSVAFFSLWDTQQKRWFAAGFVWTAKPTRVLAPHNELCFLNAFANHIMAEVGRIEVELANRAETDMLGSISHEMRSPLYGILGATEMLLGTEVSPSQAEVIYIVEACSRTLLETVDHLLDHSKINNLTERSRLARPWRKWERLEGNLSSSSSPPSQSGITRLSQIELDVMVEEGVESVLAGHNFQKKCNKRAEDPNENVAIWLSIDRATDWSFYSQPGAIRRIIMNLFGNALKYTSRGSIHIQLTSQPLPAKGNKRRSKVVFTITDTGKGVSEQFIRGNLFKPFAQEDSLSPGTGLGLSIVKQITDSLRGGVSVRSTPGEGTCVSVSLPLPHSDVRPSGEEPVDLAEQRKDLKGLRVCLKGFRDQADGLMSPTCSSKPPQPEKAAMERICKDWFQMDMVEDAESAQLTICSDNFVMETSPGNKERRVSNPLIVVCGSKLAAHSLSLSPKSARSDQPAVTEFISQPVGPRKLAKVSKKCLGRSKTARLSWSSSDSSIDLNELQRQIFNEPDVEVPPKPTRLLSCSINDEMPVLDALSSRPEGSFDTGPPDTGPPKLAEEAAEPPSYSSTTTQSISRFWKRPYVTAKDGLEALEAFKANPQRFRCVLMDISMPIMDGLESTRQTRHFERTHRPHSQPPTIIALTGLASGTTQKDAFASGVDLFLIKPARLKELGETLEARCL